MIEKKRIEDFLRANGVPATAPDEEIRSILLSASFDENEVNTALLILKENTISNETHIDTLHKVFRSDNRLKPSEISSLLGISVNLSDNDIYYNTADKRRTTIINAFFISLFVVVFVFLGLFIMMYVDQVGPFYVAD